MSVLAIIACTITAYCWAAGNETVSESTNVAQSLSGQQVKSTSQNTKGKALVQSARFMWGWRHNMLKSDIAWNALKEGTTACSM